ncbi:hypothetical protein B0H11DRAFT_2021125 [Mycena galericulata]|nr:hypothetical protein B0H11DRAFT_2021125 [Mycena galericulata]
MAQPGPAPQPNIPTMVAAYAAVGQHFTTLSQETAHFTNVGQVNLGAQMAQLTTTINNLVATVTGLTATVAANHQTALANHQTALANHGTLLQQLATLNATLTLQPMRLANATASPNAPLVGPAMVPLAVPHPLTRDGLMAFTVADCNASSTAFAAAGHTLDPLPLAPTVQDRRRQLARFLGVTFP